MGTGTGHRRFICQGQEEKKQKTGGEGVRAGGGGGGGGAPAPGTKESLARGGCFEVL